MKKLRRSEIREAAFILTFEKLFTDDTAESVIEAAYEVDEFDMDDEVEKLFISVDEKSEELDRIIAEFSEKRQFGRIPKVSVAILRIAIYEMNYDDKVPVNVAISEAVILARKFTYDPDVQFINGVLGAYAKTLDSKKESVE
ncbi:MAG: transcription antitermination factor NusB [Oscillospiraceae bacterium]|nr:transcription antitermination factor NusB [Oscillospiraceae bacterium]